MARLVGPDEGLRAVYLRNGLVRAGGRKVTLYADVELSTLADVQHLDGTPITGSQLTIDSDSRIPQFLYPDGVDVVYAVVKDGPVVALFARYDSRIDQLYQMVLDLNGAAIVTGVAELRTDVDELTQDVTVLEGEIVGKQDALPGGTATQFLRGSDKTFVAVTKTDVSLANVDNTSDTNKPVSTATQNALNLKAPTANPTFTGTVTGVTKSHVGLGNVDNTTDAAKPISTATATALGAKVSKGELAVNAKDYGVVADGVADDTTALGTAQTAAIAAGIREIYLPPGTYKHSGLTLTVSLRGAGRARTTLTGPQITMSTSNTTLSDLKVVSSTSTAILSANCQRMRLTNIEVDHDASVTDHLAWNAYNVDQMQVTGCRFNIGGLQLALCDDFVISSNFWDCQYANVNEPCHISGQSSGVFTNNTVTNTNTDCVDLYSSGHRCVVANNRFIGMRGGAGLECKVTLSDDPNNTASPGNIFDATIIANNVFRDFNSSTTSTRVGIFAQFVDNRAVKTWDVTNTNRAILITNNVLEDFNVTDPGNGALVSWQGIAFTGHNGAIRGNIIKNMRGWNGTTGEGINLSATTQGVTDGWRTVGVSIQNNTIVGIENGYAIRSGSLEQCVISDNVIRGDEDSGITTRFGIDFVANASVSYTTISNNSFHCNYSTGQAIRSGSGVIFTHCTFSDNVLRDCGVSIGEIQNCIFIGNNMNNVVNGSVFSIVGGATTSKGNSFISNHITMNSAYGLSLINMDGFVIDGCVFRGCARGILLTGTIRNGLIANCLSTGQTFGLEFPLFSGVSTADQETVNLGTNRVTNASGIATTTGATQAVTNIRLGTSAQTSVTGGTDNIAVGNFAQAALTSGASNVAVGRSSQTLITTGQANTALGDNAQAKITTPNLNTGVGSNSQANMTTGSANTAIGAHSQLSLTTGASNVAVGNRAQYAPAGQIANATTTASQQTSVGYESGQADTAQSANITTVGYRAIAAGTSSTAVGALTTASGLTSLAVGSGSTASGTYTIALGSNVNVTGAGSIAIGRDSAGLSAQPNGLTDDVVVGTYRHKTRVAHINGTANVKMFRLTGDADDTNAIVRAVATGARRIYFPPGDYTVTVPQSGTLGSWTGVDGIFIDAGEANITNTTDYAFQAGFTSIFSFTDCTNVKVEIGHYSGKELTSPLTDLGYRGEILIRLLNNCDGVIIRATVSHVRYAVQSGEYDDPTKGYCKNMDIQLRAYFCGYPIALYLSEGIRFDIDADDVHRGAYLAGCIDVTGELRWKNQYIADTMLLITDAKTGVGTSRGCRQLRVSSLDKGSTRTEPSTKCAGITLSRVDPHTVYEDIHMTVYSKSTDVISSQVGAFRIVSGVTGIPSLGYTSNWDPTIILRNITLSGVMDHSDQTIEGNLAGEFDLRVYDYIVTTPVTYGTLENFVFEDLTILQSSGMTKLSYVIAPLLAGAGVTFNRVYAPDTTLFLETNAVASANFIDSTFKQLYQTVGVSGGTGAKSKAINSTFTEYFNSVGNTNPVDALNSSFGGASAKIQHKQMLWNLASGTTTLTNFIPANSLVLGVQGILTQTTTGATGFQVGVSGALNRYGTIVGNTAGTSFTTSNSSETTPRYYTADTSLLITATGSNFSGGQIKVVVHYIVFTPPTV